MRKVLNIVAAIFIAGILMSSHGCKEDPPKPTTGTFELNITPKVNGQTFQNGLIYQNIKGRSYTLLDFKMYLSNISLVKEDGSELLLSEVELFDIGNGGSAKTNHGEGAYKTFADVPNGKYKGLKFGIGVTEAQNDKSPTDYSSGHPLANTTMYWSWLTGYRFVIIEGKIDDSPAMDGSSMNTGLAYHTGLNSLYREISFVDGRHAFEITGGGEEIQAIIEMDVNRLFYNATDTLDMLTQNISHTTPEGSEAYELAKTVTDNLANNALFKP